ncbi:MAG: GNAT family N-acetyltransferase [Proteobacteria bacterium]|nr:GNAT family N-acetyltransferase [Pseudomonadota bacterium]
MTAHAIALRPAAAGDARAIAQMSRDLVESGLGWKYDPDRVMRAIAHRETTTLVACEDGRRSAAPGDPVAGFSIMEFGDERAHLVLLAVRPSHRRLGLGRRMLEWLTDSALTAGMQSIHLELRAGNEAARAFYRAMGYSGTMLVPGYYRGRESALRMIRVLRVPGEETPRWRPPAR